ncbi:MAG: glutamine synthetase [bacterium]|nr:glutamine synthetase [bacterium]
MSDYDRIRVLWPDHLGLARGKYLPVHLAEQGTGHCITTFALGYDRSLIPAPGAYLLEGLPDVVASFDPDEVRPSWEDDATGVVVGHLNFRGLPYTVSARYALQQAIADWAELGYAPKVGIEFEAYVLQPDGAGGWERWDTPRSFVYGTGRSADPVGLLDDIMRIAWECGFPLESINAEYDESQFELTLEYDDALKAADEAFLFRVLAREVALAHGLDLTFLGKPFVGVAGSGVHVNFSLVDGDGQNAFNDPSADDGLSALAKGCLAGLVDHHQGLTALCAPTVNAYRRLQPAELNGYWANWGHDHRCAANRIPEARGAATRIENRVGDGAVNIHLGVATVLQAARLGVADGLECPDPLTSDGFEEVNTDIGAAPSLAVALEHLTADSALMAAVGDDLCQNFIANKQAEWERYIAAVGEDVPGGEVTQWELDEYLMYH